MISDTLMQALLSSIIPAVVGWLVTRLSAKIDRLVEQDTKFSVELAELRVRVTHLELLVQERLK